MVQMHHAKVLGRVTKSSAVLLTVSRRLIAMICRYCGEWTATSKLSGSGLSWQQWHCLTCDSWNDWPARKIHVVPIGNRWAVTRDNPEVVSFHDTLEHAQKEVERLRKRQDES